MLPDEELSKVNRIGSCRRGNRYVLYSDRIGAGAASIVTGRVNEQVKRNIQRKETHLIVAKYCGITTGRPAAVVYHQNVVWRISRACRARSSGPTLQNINQRSVCAGCC